MRLSPKQAAAIAEVSVGTVYNWCSQKALPHYRVGAKGKRGKIQIEQDALEAFLLECRVEAATPTLELKHINLP